MIISMEYVGWYNCINLLILIILSGVWLLLSIIIWISMILIIFVSITVSIEDKLL